jgi:hypothetical protein
MSALIVDEALLREPCLWVPFMPPLGSVKVDWSHPLAKSLASASLVSSNGYVDIVGENPRPWIEITDG